MILLFYLIVGVYAVCQEGQYNDVKLSSCQNCPAGFHNSRTNLNECLRCNPGKFQPASGGVTCSNCPEGRTQPNQNATECFVCATYISYDYRCVETCPNGSWPSVNTCDYCEEGSYSEGNSRECLKCPLGEYKEGASPNPCATCPTGWESIDSRNACQQCGTGEGISEGTCKTCVAGKFSPNNQTCLPCSKGKYQAEQGQNACRDCLPGQFSEVSGQQGCVDCAAGFYSTGGALECIQCALGNGTSSQGQSSCQTCEGAETVQGICTKCVAGRFLTDKRCEDCPRGFISATGATECTNCPKGKFANTTNQLCEECGDTLVPNVRNANGSWKCCGSDECDDCAAGKYRVDDDCEECPSGYVSKAGKPCRACIKSEGEYTKDHLDDCDYCAEGKASNGMQCTACHAGKYEFKFECINCPRGWFSNEGINPVCKRCQLGYTGPAESISQGQCTTECAANEIVDSFGYCQQCDLGKYVNGRVCEDCPLGTHKDTRAGTLCRDCPSGFNTDSTQNIDCFACPPGQQCGCQWGQFGTGTDCKDCPVGYSSSGGLECSACPLTTYQSERGQGACLNCPPGTFGDTTATVQCKDCISGQFQIFTGAGACEDCPRGRWGGGVQCQNCTVGKSTLQAGSTSKGQCRECPVGKMEKDRLCIDCYEGTYQNNTGSVVCDACPLDKWSAPGASDLAECFGTKGLTTYTFGSIEDSKEATPYKTLCELRANFVMVCPGCTCDADARNGFWAGPMCNECRRGFSTRFCTSICPGYDGQHDSTICNGNGRCWFGRQGNGLCYCGGHHILDSSSENVFVDVQYCPAGKICPGYGVEKVPVTTYIPLYYLINYRQYTSFVLQMSKYTPERGHMWFTRFSPSKAFGNTCTVCNSKYLDSALTEIGYWNKESEYIPFPVAAQTRNGFHGENCQYECAACLNGGECVYSPHPYRYSYTIENTFKEQSSAIYPTTTCLCSSNVYDASHMCCPNGFQPYVYYGKRATTPYARFTTVPYVTSVDNNIDLGYYRDIDIALEKGITIPYIESRDDIIHVGEGARVTEATFSNVGPYNKHVYHGTTKEICRACPGLFGKGVRAVDQLIETEQAAENYWWNFPASAGSKKCQGQGVCDFYKKDKEFDVDFMGDINDYVLLRRGRMCKSKSIGGFVSTDGNGQDITNIEQCIQYARDNSAFFIGWAPEFYMGGLPEDMYKAEMGTESAARQSASARALEGWVKNTAGTSPLYSTLLGQLPEPDTDSTYEIHPRISKRCIAFASCTELRPLKSTAYRAFNIYSVEKGRGDERLPTATFDRFDTCFTYTKNYDHDPDKTGQRQKYGLYLTQDYKQGDDPFLGGLCPKGYFCTQNSDGTGFKEACPVGYYQPLEGQTRTDRDTHCSHVSSNHTSCQTNLATKSSIDYVDNVCLRCARNSYAPQGSYECTECPSGRVKKVSGSFAKSSIEIYNMPSVGSTYWYYMTNEQGMEGDDCAIVPPSVIHVPTGNKKMFESHDDEQYLPVLSCPYGYSSQPGTYIIEDMWNMVNIIENDKDVMVEPYINIQSDKQVYESDIPCSCIPSNTVERYVTPESAEMCAELNFKAGGSVGHGQTIPGLWHGCLRFDQSFQAEYLNDPLKAHNYPTNKNGEVVKYICQKEFRDNSLMETFVSTYCYPCPGDSMTGPASSMCSTCTANLIKKNMKLGLQKLVMNSEARMYHCIDDNTQITGSDTSPQKLPPNVPPNDTLCPMVDKKYTDESIDIFYKKDIPSRYYLQTLEKTWPAHHVFGFIKDPLMPGDSVELSITDCILACSTVFTKPNTGNYKLSNGVRPVRVGYAKETGDRKYCLCNEGVAPGYTYLLKNYTVKMNGFCNKTNGWEYIDTVAECQQALQELTKSGDITPASGGWIAYASFDQLPQGCTMALSGNFYRGDFFVNSNASGIECGGTYDCVCKRNSSAYPILDASPIPVDMAKGIAVTNEHTIPGRECYALIQQNPKTIRNEACITKQSVKILWYESVIIDSWSKDEFPLCGLCKPGTMYTGSECVNCAAGTYTSNMQESMKDSCENCPAGFFIDSEGRTGCKECRPGFFQAAKAGEVCYNCPLGFHQDGFATTSCKHCKQGRYQPLEAQPNCLLCDAGKFEPSTHNDSTINNQPCTECQPGYSQDERGKGRCKDCPAGWYQPSSTQLQCIECAPGQFQSEQTKFVCIACPKGYAQDISKQHKCKPCSNPDATDNSAITQKCTSQSGCDWSSTSSATLASQSAKYQDVPGQTTCKACPSSNICTVDEDTDKCGAGHVMPAGHYTRACYFCDKSTYAQASDQSACKECTKPSILNAAKTTCTSCLASDGKYPQPTNCGIDKDSTPCTSCLTCKEDEYVLPDTHVCDKCGWKTPIRDSGDGTKCTTCKATTYWSGTQCVDCPAVGWNEMKSPGESREISDCDGCGGFKLHWYEDKHKGNEGSMQKGTNLDSDSYLRYKGPFQTCCWDTNDYVKISTWIVTEPDLPGYLHISNSVDNAVNNPYEDWIDYTLKVDGTTIKTELLHETKNSKKEFCLQAGKIFYFEFEYQNADGNGNFNVYTYNARTFKTDPGSTGASTCTSMTYQKPAYKTSCIDTLGTHDKFQPY